MPIFSANTAPNVGIRSDYMGLAIVNKLSANRALIIAKDGFRDDMWILVTPEDTYKDATLDLTEKLKLNMKVAYKANRMQSQTYKGLAVYVRPIDDCYVGDGSICEIKPTLCYAESSKFGSIFFPVSAMKESILSEPFLRRNHNMDKCLRIGDPVSFVAINDESTRNRSAYALEVNLSFNRDATKPMIGIITETRHSSCTVWAKNFPLLYFDDFHFGLDSSADLRGIFSAGDRVSFRATKIGCDYDGISQIEAINYRQIAKLRDARAAVEAGSRRSKPQPMDGGIKKPISENHVSAHSTKNLAGAFGGLNIHDKATRGAAATIDDKTEKEMYASGGHDDADSQKCVIKKVDAEVQVHNMFEEEAVRQLLQDEEIFKLALQRFPTMVRDVMRMRRMI